MYPRLDPYHAKSLIWAVMYPFTRVLPKRVNAWHTRLGLELDMHNPAEPDPLTEAYQCVNPACGCNSAKHDLPPARDPFLVVMQGKPIDGALEQVFSPWGKPKGIVADSESIVVQYEGNYQLRFIPISEN